MSTLDDLFRIPAPGKAKAEPPPVIIDRSTLEQYSTCPFQGHAIEHQGVLTASPEADAGNEVHRVIAESIAAMLASGLAWQSERQDYLGRLLNERILETRPDVQPQAIEGLKRSVWSIAHMIADRDPADVMRLDPAAHGTAEHERSGQLAWDILPAEGERGPVRLTCGVDLLLAESESDVTLVDWKSGRTEWSPTAIRESFQFGCFYTALIFLNYPGVETVRVIVWDTRRNHQHEAHFHRSRLPAQEARLLSATRIYLDSQGVDQPACWPGPDKCDHCPATRLCPAVSGDPVDVNADPQGYLMRMVAVERRLNVMKAAAKAYAKEHGPIRVGDQEWPIYTPSYAMTGIPAAPDKTPAPKQAEPPKVQPDENQLPY